MAHPPPLLHTHDLGIGYRAGNKGVKTLAAHLQLEMDPGQLICLLGPNGAGKSTLIRTLAGLQPALAGTVAIGGRALANLKPGERARLLSIVLTERVRSGNLNVSSIIALGRYPHTNWLGTLAPRDREMVQWAMDTTGTAAFAQRRLEQLSDGEAQKVMLARALAQDTPVIILDEPTAHLDLPNRVSLMRLLHQLARTTQKAVLLSTHDLDLALQTADQVWLLGADGRMATGAPEDLVLNGTLEAVFQNEGFLFDKATGTFSIHQGGEQSIFLKGKGAAGFWTKRALQRAGFRVVAEAAAYRAVEIEEADGRLQWRYRQGTQHETHHRIADLLASLQRKNPSEGPPLQHAQPFTPTNNTTA
ncbi:ABC transporter ATP-binding protein [Paraflavisolibacter sp. H34]|uniref:ABC transporter ATP-binding protein n=1 Tax=Huijunlia imazamoxiresistens TaxID=3127457 RepID=UPI00301AFC3A